MKTSHPYRGGGIDVEPFDVSSSCSRMFSGVFVPDPYQEGEGEKERASGVLKVLKLHFKDPRDESILLLERALGRAHTFAYHKIGH